MNFARKKGVRKASGHRHGGARNNKGKCLFPLLFHRLPDVLESGNEIIKDFRRNHDPVPVGAYLFRNTHHFAARILFEIKKERLAFGNNLLCANNIVLHGCNLPPVE